MVTCLNHEEIIIKEMLTTSIILMTKAMHFTSLHPLEYLLEITQ